MVPEPQKAKVSEVEVVRSWTLTSSLWFLAGNGGMEPYDTPLRSPIVVPKNPFLHSLLRTSQSWG